MSAMLSLGEWLQPGVRHGGGIAACANEDGSGARHARRSGEEEEPMGIDREEDAGALGAELGLHALTTALARVMDAVPAELILCTAAGSVLHANHSAQKRLDADDGRRSLEEEIRFLCVTLHLQIAEKAAVKGTEAVSHAERRVTVDGSEMHLRAVDLGVARDGLNPVILVLLVVQPF